MTKGDFLNSRANAASKSLPFRVNNFDLLRLLAASQVVVVHAFHHFGVFNPSIILTILVYFPGVPIFFVVSGFLISASWEKAPSAKSFGQNRFLRLYPALWVCLFFTIAVFLAGGVRPPLGDLLTWILAQATIAPFYNPDFLRSFGVGVINGALWTISVELQFYIVLPLLAALAGRHRHGWWILGPIFLGLLFIARMLEGPRDLIWQKLLHLTVVPYLFYFWVGIAGRHLYLKRPFLFEDKAPYWLATYIIWVILAPIFGFARLTGNYLNPISILIIGALTISVAFSARTMARRILQQHDISYGLYIYHMPVVNVLLVVGVSGNLGVVLTLLLAVVLAAASWLLVERPILRRKAYSLRNSNRTSVPSHNVDGQEPAMKTALAPNDGRP